MRALVENQTFTAVTVMMVLIALFALERVFPLRKPRRRLLPRLMTNFLMAGLTLIAALFLVRPSALAALSLASNHSFGLLNLFQAAPIVKFILALLLLDLSFYYWHRLNHSWSFLWRFHNTHHLDPDLDTSTAFRFHFGEVALSAIFRFTQVIVIGPTLFAFLSFELFFRIATFFHHSNLRLPKKLDNILKFIIVTPRMHGIHHSNYKNETDSNYSVIFSFWDRVHKSFQQNISQEEIEIGIPGYSNPQDNQVKAVIIDPFKKQRDYWMGRIKRSN